MSRFRCYRPQCPAGLRDRRPAEFEGDEARCPECHAGPPVVLKLVDVHMLVPHEKGPFEDQITGERRQLACMPDRDVLAVPHGMHFAATEDAQAVTCPVCRRHAHFALMAKALAEVRPGFVIAPCKNCGDN